MAMGRWDDDDDDDDDSHEERTNGREREKNEEKNETRTHIAKRSLTSAGSISPRATISGGISDDAAAA